MVELKKVNLGDIITFKNGKKKPAEEGTIPIYGGNGILGYTDRSNYKNCIAVGRVGAYCGSVYYEPGECWISDNAIAATPKADVDIYFAFYLLKSLNLNQRHIGTSQPLLTQEILNKIECQIPDLDIQKKISNILRTMDGKVECNTAINRNLQEQAVTLYKEMIIDCADDRWSDGVLSDIAIITMGQSPKGDTYNETGDGTVFYQGRGEFGDRFPTRRLYTSDPKRMAQTNDVLMSVRAPVGDFNVAYENCCIGRGLASIRSKDKHQSYILYTIVSIQDALNMYNGEGTVFGSINKDALNGIQIVIPPVSVMDEFENIVEPLDESIKRNYEEICRLTNLRDALLPKLMSGELDVSDIDI